MPCMCRRVLMTVLTGAGASVSSWGTPARKAPMLEDPYRRVARVVR